MPSRSHSVHELPLPARVRQGGLVVAAVWLLALPNAVAAQQPPLDGLDRYVQQAVADWAVPGLAVAVVKDGEVVFAKGYGTRTLGRQERVDTRTLFAIGSTTKAMTAAALGLLVDEGTVAWDDPVTRHLPWFELYDPYVTREVTVRDLLTHRAGLGNADFLWYEQENSTPEIVRRLRYVQPAYSVRSGFIYQNIMYATAGEVVAAASGKPWSEFVRTRIFEPLEMTGTVPTAETLAERPNVASPHYRIDDRIQVIENASVDAVAAAGSVWSSVEDMAKWIGLLLSADSTGTTRLWSAAVHRELFTPHAMVSADQFYPTARLTEPHWTTYGLGWFQADYRGRAVDFHTGSIDGMVAIVGLIRDEQLGVCVLANLDHAEVRHAIMYRVFDLYDDGSPRDWSAELRELYGGLRVEAERRRADAEAQRVSGTRPSLQLDEYVGVYSDSLYGTVRVTKRDSTLHLHYGPGLQGPLEHWNYDTFRVSWEATWRGTDLATFRLSPRGEVDVLEFNGAEFARERPQR